VQEVGGAVERIDNPQMCCVTSLVPTGLLADKAVAWPRFGELLAQDFLRLAVGGGDEIGRPLERDLQMLHLAEVALERAAREPCGLDHDIEQGGMEHDPRSCSFFGEDAVCLHAPSLGSHP